MNPWGDFSNRVLYEDNHLLVVNKPPGLLVQGDATGRATLLDEGKHYIKERYHKPGQVWLGLVHRLDRQVGGVVVLARTSKAASRLSAQFRDHSLKKIYWAVVEGTLVPKAGEVEHLLVRDGRISRPAKSDREPGQPARLRYRTLETGTERSLLEIELLTGRRHQIRAQMAHLGHPIQGDTLYGAHAPPQQDAIGLFARSLTLKHPTRPETLTFEADPGQGWPWLPL